MPSRRAPRKRQTVSSFDLYAQAMLDHWLGKKVVFEFERDDGYRSRSLVAAYRTPPAKWSKIERAAMKEVRGRVLDVGCGPGRHAVYLQRKGHRVVGIDASPTQVALARIRGVEEVYQASVQRLPRGLGTFDTIIPWGTTSASPGTSRGCDDSCETRGKFRRPAGASSAAPGSQGRGFESTCRT